MKAEIHQVLKMNKEGTLTDDQAAELLAELAHKEAREEADTGGNRARGNDGGRGPFTSRNWEGAFVEPLLDKMNTTVKYALDAAFGWDKSPGGAGMAAEGHQGEAFERGGGGQSGNNRIHMSRFEMPAGKDHVFTGNTVRMSSVKDMRLDRAEMIDNTIDMSKVVFCPSRTAR